MRKLIVLSTMVLGLALGGCGGDDKFDAVLKELDTFRAQMCECKDAACAQKVWDGWIAYRLTMRDKLGKDAKPSDVQSAKGNSIVEAMNTCRAKVDPRPARPAAGADSGGSGSAAGSAAP
jgi:hypothetical protein